MACMTIPTGCALCKVSYYYYMYCSVTIRKVNKCCGRIQVNAQKSYSGGKTDFAGEDLCGSEVLTHMELLWRRKQTALRGHPLCDYSCFKVEGAEQVNCMPKE